MTERTVEILEDSDRFVFPWQLAIPNTYPAGVVGSKFLIELRDNKKIKGIKCPECNQVYVPPRSTCKYCFGELSELVDVSDKGTLVTYAVSYEPTPVQPVEGTPVIYGIVKLDGADTGFVHMLGEVDPKQLEIGMRVKAVFKTKKKRVASILDIKYFKPLKI
ncbi:MAG: Zn-ribbon domain-containing OB-fold protein [Chloroflexi bacterium]|nr:Zn-ribbon domain-containing OB-fold protein [Chloroflexota bacterium]